MIAANITTKKANKLKSLVSLTEENGAPERIRTSGTRIRNPVLYPTELLEQKKTECELNPHIEAVLFGSNSKKERRGQ